MTQAEPIRTYGSRMGFRGRFGVTRRLLWLTAMAGGTWLAGCAGEPAGPPVTPAPAPPPPPNRPPVVEPGGFAALHQNAVILNGEVPAPAQVDLARVFRDPDGDDGELTWCWHWESVEREDGSTSEASGGGDSCDAATAAGEDGLGGAMIEVEGSWLRLRGAVSHDSRGTLTIEAIEPGGARATAAVDLILCDGVGVSYGLDANGEMVEDRKLAPGYRPVVDDGPEVMTCLQLELDANLEAFTQLNHNFREDGDRTFDVGTVSCRDREECFLGAGHQYIHENDDGSLWSHAFCDSRERWAFECEATLEGAPTECEMAGQARFRLPDARPGDQVELTVHASGPASGARARGSWEETTASAVIRFRVAG